MFDVASSSITVKSTVIIKNIQINKSKLDFLSTKLNRLNDTIQANKIGCLIFRNDPCVFNHGLEDYDSQSSVHHVNPRLKYCN